MNGDLSSRKTIFARCIRAQARPCDSPEEASQQSNRCEGSRGRQEAESRKRDVQSHEAGDGSRSVTCKGHAESGTTCRGKASRVGKASHASRRAKRKRSWRLSQCATSARNRRMRTPRETRQGCQSWSLSRSLRPGWDFAETGPKLPREPGDPRSDSGVVKTLDSSVQMGATRLVHARRKP